MIKFGLHKQDIEKINAIFFNHPKVNYVILYGSRAKGDFKNGSDIDITIENSVLDFQEFLTIEDELDELFLPYKIDLSQKNQIKNTSLLEHIDRVGLPFYKKIS